MKHRNHYYYLPKEKAELVLNKYGIKLPEFTEIDVFVTRDYRFWKYKTYLDCRDSWGMGARICVEEKLWCYLPAFGGPDNNWKSLSEDSLI